MAKLRWFSRLKLAALALLLLTFLASAAWATPYRTPAQIAEEYARSGRAFEPQNSLPTTFRGRSSLDEEDYWNHYHLLCTYLATRQYAGAGNNRGGMIEGESGGDQNIIETDNTQEAIRIWSQYAIWTGDTATFGPAIRLAWGYCQRYPAWDEGDGYYSMHNCGWGFEAERKYRQAYSDTSWNWYADSCASWVVGNLLYFNPNSTDLGQLDPLAEGLAVGGLYPHALYRNRADWQTFAVTQGRRLRRWFESNPARLNANENWALCGGTALWGVCETVFAQYPDSGRIWLAQYGHFLDVWQPSGQWNNSYNAWYCNAQHKCYEITGDAVYWQNAIYITDSLIHLDTDHDGGIPPGVGYSSANDHSWVSSYMGWMGMSRFIDRGAPIDVAAQAFVSPDPDRPHLAGDSLVVSVCVVNRGTSNLTARVRVLSPAYSESLMVALVGGADSVVTFARKWVVPDDNNLPVRSPLLLDVSAQGDTVLTNDTLTAAFDVRHGGTVLGSVTAEFTHAPLVATVEFYHEAYPDSAWQVVRTSADGSFTSTGRGIMTGTTRVHIVPEVAYLDDEHEITLTPDILMYRVDVTMPRTQLALIDDSPGDSLETYYQSSLDSFSYRVRTWDNEAMAMGDLSGIRTVIWFTGNATGQNLTTSEQATITAYLQQGGHLILTGQNVTDDLGAGTFLSGVLHCSQRTDALGLTQVMGVDGNPISDGLHLSLSGVPGAGNQTSTSSIYPLEGSTEIFHYGAGTQEVCGVSGSYGEGKYIFLTFGLEGASGLGSSNTRNQALARFFEWFGDSASVAGEKPSVPLSFDLAQNFPNPFNPVTTIRFVAPRGDGRVSLAVFNMLGQQVRTLYDGMGTGNTVEVSWDGLTSAGERAASGTYVYRLSGNHVVKTRTLQLVR